MLKFIRENWIWIVAPIVVVAVLIIALALFGGDEAVSPFQYQIF
jgi:ABC-type dipeptide/oligopeptide/nickel transport system permease subunit